MSKKETHEERKARLLEQLARGRETRRKNAEARAESGLQSTATSGQPTRPRKRPANLDKIVREVLDDQELIDKVVQNQPEYWGRLPVKNGAYIIATVMMVKAMGGDIKAAEWIRKSGYGDKVVLDDQGGFFGKTDFTIKVLPSTNDDVIDDIKPSEVLESEIRQVDDTAGTSDT
ncbi:MAG: hypothetical protein KDA17_06705 [Candidatus Saccharibacteria bacterium]|nr:hypothetical protein [Candidatus Saccharibacteria bacterium]